MNRMLAVGAFTGAMVFALPVSADSGNGVLNFSGSVVNAPCNLSMEQANQDVELGQFNKAGPNGGGVGPDILFSITLTDCSATPAQISWTGSHGTLAFQLYTSTPGLLLYVFYEGGDKAHYFDGTPVPIPGGLAEGTNEIKLATHVYSVNWSAVAEGPYTASANFTMHYD